nr:hypothetical protein [uncultured Allomuricauda sp.]
MKYKFLLLSLTVMFGLQFSFGQENAIFDFNADELIGTWRPTYDNRTAELTFERQVETERKYGLWIEILKSGEFRSRYSAPCGNDSMLRTHNYNGIWSLDEDEWILTTSEPINRNGTLFKIVELKSDKMVLAEIKIE